MSDKYILYEIVYRRFTFIKNKHFMFKYKLNNKINISYNNFIS